HQNDILHQARSTFEAIHGNKTTYGLYNGDEKARHTVQFLFASLQTMRGHCRGFRPDEFDYIVVDESHHTYADTYLDVVNYWHPKFLLGITATPDRTDGQDIRRVFGMEIFFLPLDEALAQDLLTPVDYRMLSDEIQLSQVVETPRGRMSIDKLNRLIFIPKRDEEIAKIIAKHAKTFENPRTIIFCASVAHCDHLAKFVENSMPLHSRVPAIERSVRLEMFRQGMIKTVLTVDVFNEGIDIPQANVLVFLRSTASALIFLQQLGRGLRKSDGKDKVIALDFVGNCDRIRMVYNLWESTMKKREAFLQKLKEGGKGGKGTSCPLTPDYGSREPMTLNVNTIDFKEKIVKILEIIGPRNFYPTWQEASRAAIALGISTAEEYRREKKYQADPKLPCNPNLVYSDYPGDTIFFGRVKKSFYRSWQQASKKAKLLGAKNVEEYRNLCPKDPHLPRCPDTFYADFPGWYEFLGTDKYPTWQEASKAAQALGINSFDDYARRYKEDPRLPASPHAEYKDYPGLHTFLGLKKIYETLEEASKAVVALGIKSGAKYRIMSRTRSSFQHIQELEKG
ncbi:MAG: DEAD/DEAH box helicase family protein, partial [Candidatus Taylorbacteria bacterium]|nr:DEAD/DEAH box helicase family protein [Candidatus Taylorbacteria bacterium]